MLGTFRYFRCKPLTHGSIVDGGGKYAPIYSTESYGDPAQANASSGLPLLFGESDDGDDPLGLALVPGERGVEGGLALEEVVAFGAEDLVGVHVDCLVPDLDLNVGVGFEVVVPVRVGIGTPL